MIQRFFIFDAEACFGCLGCVAACANANGTPPGLFWRTVHKLPPEGGDSRTRWLSLACNHCENPPCVQGCPSGALRKRTEDGVVLFNADLCIGCRYCQMTCPFGAIRWDLNAGRVSKCHFCHERLAEGREPACVETCFAGALSQRAVESEDELDALDAELPGFQSGTSASPSIRFVREGERTAVPREKPFPPGAADEPTLSREGD